MAYSPDDLFLLPDGRRFLIDYKTPYAGIIPQKEPFAYVAQLHQGKIVLEEQCDLPVDGMLLVYGEHPESLAKPESLKLHFYRVDFDADLAKEIPVVAREFAQALMNNERPSVLDRDSIAEIRALDLDYIRVTSQIRALQERADRIKARMSGILEGLSATDMVGAGEETLSSMSVIYKIEDPDRLMSLLQEAAPEILEDTKTLESWRKKGGLDIGKVTAYLKEQQVDLEPFLGPDTWDSGKIVKDERVISSGALENAMDQGIVSRSIVWRVSEKAVQKAAALETERVMQDAAPFEGDLEDEDCFTELSSGQGMEQEIASTQHSSPE